MQASDPVPTANNKLADGGIIHNQGRKNFAAPTEDWELKTIRAAVAKVDTPILSVGGCADGRHGGVLSQGQVHRVQNWAPDPLTASKGLYNLKMWGPKNQASPFQGQA